MCILCHSASTEAPSGPSITDRVLLPSWFTPETYNLTLTPNLQPPYRFEGELELTAAISEVGQTAITLHSKELAYHTCSITQNDATQECSSISLNLNDSTVSFGFKDPLVVGKCVLKIAYAGTHNNQMAGFYRSGYKNAEGKPAVMVSTQFEALDARRCLPCIDEPAAKAIFKATLIVDENLTALSNMPESEVTVMPASAPGTVRKKKVSFLPSPKMSTYLLAFALGEFDFLQARTAHGVLVRVFTPPTKAKLGTFALDVAVKSLDLYDDYFGKPYPLPKLDMIAIPEFAMGAMENWGLVTYREVEVLIAENASADQKQRVCTVITHELAHQWFGNLVTMSWWEGLWLNEGFASWMQTYAADKIFPEWDFWSQFVVDDQATALSLDSLMSSHPVQVPIKRAEEVEEVFDAISYHKGACVVQLANAYLGPEVFQRGLQLYMARHAYGNTETGDLWQAWDEAAGGAKPVAKVMRSWTEQMGFPVLKVDEVVVDQGKFTLQVAQSWFLADGSQPDPAKTWNVPLIASYSTGDGDEDIVVNGVEVGMLDGSGPREFSIEAKGLAKNAKHAWVKLNAGQHVPVRVAYSPVDVARLSRAIKAKDVDSRDRAGMLLDAYALAKAGTIDPGAVLVLLSAFKQEDNMAVWDAVEQVLGGLASLTRGTELEPKLCAFAGALIKDRCAELGWEEQPTDGHLDKLSRAILVRLQCKFQPNDAQVKQKCQTLLEQFLAEPNTNSIPADLKQPVLRVGLLHGSRKELKALQATLDVLETVAQKKDVYAAVGFTPSEEDKLQVLEWCTSGAIKLQDFFYPMSSVSVSSAQGGELCFKFMKDNFARIHGMVKTASPSLINGVIAYCCQGFASVERANEIEAFFRENSVPLATRKVAQIVENTKANAAFLGRIKSSVLFKDHVVG